MRNIVVAHNIFERNTVFRHQFARQRLRPAHGLGHKVEFLAVFAAAQLNADAVRVAAVRVEIDAARAAVHAISASRTDCQTSFSSTK